MSIFPSFGNNSAAAPSNAAVKVVKWDPAMGKDPNRAMTAARVAKGAYKKFQRGLFRVRGRRASITTDEHASVLEVLQERRRMDLVQQQPSFAFFLLPTAVLVEIIGAFLQVADLVRLDTATSSTRSRAQLHELLGGALGIGGIAFDRHTFTKNTAARGMEWALRHRLHFDVMQIRVSDDDDEWDGSMWAGGADEDEGSEGEEEKQLDEVFTTALHWACQRGEERLVRLLLENDVVKVQVDSMDSGGKTPLLVACEFGKQRCVKLLVSLGKADVNITDKSQYSALYMLCEPIAGLPALVEELLRCGADPNVQNSVNGMTPLHRACDNGALETVMVLVRFNGGKFVLDPNLLCMQGNTPLHYCALHPVMLTRVLLVEAGAKTDLGNNRELTPLHLAIQEGRADLVRCLVDGGASVAQTLPCNVTPLMLAADQDDTGMMQILLSGGADPNTVDIDERSALHRACAGNRINAVRTLVQAGCNVNLCAADGSSPLYRSAEFGLEDISRLLILEGRADLTELNKQTEMSPLAIAQECELYSVSKLIQDVLSDGVDAYLKQHTAAAVEEDAVDIDPTILSHLSLGGTGRFQYVIDVKEGSERTAPSSVEVFTRLQAAAQTVGDTSLYNRDQLPLFADDVWPGSKVLADLLQRPDILAEHVKNRRVVELGAGAALPSVVATLLGATFVCACDYPADGIVENIAAVLKHNNVSAEKAIAVGHAWGDDATALLPGGTYDTALLAELFWKDTVHLHFALITSLLALLTPGGVAFAAFAHRPTEMHKPADDLAFFTLAASAGFEVEYLPEVRRYADVGEAELVAVQVVKMIKV